MLDSIVIGGGPAGLTCAIYLARFRKSVLLIENNKYRNYSSNGVHGYLGYDGVKPQQLLKKARNEASKYGVVFYNSTVIKIVNKNNYFEIICNKQKFKSKKLLLAYGVRDLIPPIAGFKKYYGKQIHHCPVCDGYEVTGKKIGVLGTLEKSFGLALELKQWTKDILLLTNGVLTKSKNNLLKKLKDNNILVVNEKISKVDGDNKILKNLIFSNNKKILIDGLFFCSEIESTCNFAKDLKCKMDKDSKVMVNRYGETSIKGLFAAGDITPGPQLVITACADGAIAAIEINKQL